MVHTVVTSPKEQLRILADQLGAIFYEDDGSSYLTLDNSKGNGVIRNYDISEGISARVYDIEITKEYALSLDGIDLNPLYFLYCLEGYYYHTFNRQNETRRVGEMQNVIFSDTGKDDNSILLPSNVKIQLSVILVRRDSDENLYGSSLLLGNMIEETYKLVVAKSDHKYFENIDPAISEFAKLLISNVRTDVVGKIITEAAVLNTLASQLDSFLKVEKRNNATIKYLSVEELQRIAKVAVYVNDNISEKITIPQISKELGIGVSKLQTGVKHLFGVTVNTLIINIKLEHAKSLLLTTDASVSEVVYKIGLSSRSYFSKKFREQFGINPSNFKYNLENSSSVFELVYKSGADPNLTLNDVGKIVELSQEKNRRLGVTGCLVYFENSFFQIIEGQKKDVLKLYQTICSDPRHCNVKLLWKGLKATRLFEEWDMGLISDRNILSLQSLKSPLKINLEEILSRSESSDFNSNHFWRNVFNKLKLVV